MGIWYTTLEAVKSALDIKATARNDAQIGRAIESASRSVEGLLNRVFYPTTGTRYFPWPNYQYTTPWRLWLDSDELIAVTTVSAGGVTIAASDYFLEPINAGPPYTSIEIDLSSTAAFTTGSTHQRNIAITGVFGYTHDHETVTTASEAINASETSIDVANSGVVGVGDIFEIDDEHLICTAKTMKDTGVNIDASDSLTASNADVSITLSTTTAAPNVGETILIDSERMLVVDVAGSVITVKRQYDGSVLATHAANADIYAPRTLTMTRGALGTTAASHLINANIEHVLIPAMVRDLTVAEAINIFQQETSGYARTVGSGDNERESTGRGLADLRRATYAAYGRKARIRAV